MRYCSDCGSGDIRLSVPDGDNRERYVCHSCHKIFYNNPKIVSGCILEWEGQVLLCRRAIEPAYGLWTIPAGFMENHESIVEAAAREADEEACAQTDDLYLHSIYDLKHVSQVYIIYRGVLSQGAASAGQETLEIRLWGEEDLPWQAIAFPVVKEALQLYFADRAQGSFGVHQGEITRDEDQRLVISRYREPHKRLRVSAGGG